MNYNKTYRTNRDYKTYTNYNSIHFPFRPLPSRTKVSVGPVAKYLISLMLSMPSPLLSKARNLRTHCFSRYTPQFRFYLIVGVILTNHWSFKQFDGCCQLI